MLEEMDQCILARGRLEPEIRAWLGSTPAATTRPL